MRRIACGSSVIAAIVVTVPALAADWADEWGGGASHLRGSFLEPEAWSPYGGEDDDVDIETGVRYWYSWGEHRTTILGDSYAGSDQSHIGEAHLRIDDKATDFYGKVIAGYSAAINASWNVPWGTGSSQRGQILYVGGDIGYMPFRHGKSGVGAFVGYQYWNDSPDMGEFDYGGGGTSNLISYHLLRLGVGGRADFGWGDVTAEVAAIPYAPVEGRYGTFVLPGGLVGNQTSSGSLSGWLYGGAAEVMARVHPTENWTVGVGGRAWYLTGNADVRFTTDAGGGTNWITKTTNFSTLRYGLMAEATYRF